MEDKREVAREKVGKQFIYIECEAQTTPNFKPVRNGDYIKYGDNNDYDRYIIDLYQRCAENNAIINAKANFVFGKGLSYHKTNDAVVDGKLEKFISYANLFESWNDLLPKPILNFELIDGFYIQYVFGRNRKIVSAYAMDTTRIRRSTDCKGFWYCEDWSDRAKVNEKKYYPEYNDTLKEGSCIYYCKVTRPAINRYGDTYSIPSYVGALNAIETDINIDVFFNALTQNGMTAQGMLTLFNGEPANEEEAKEVERQWKKKFTGARKAGGFMLNFADADGKPAELVNFSATDLDKQFEILSKRNIQKITSGHRIDPVLIGIDTATSWDRPQLINKWERFNTEYVRIRQEKILEAIKIMGISQGVAVDQLYFEPLPPLGEELEISENTLKDILTVPELRAYVRDKKGIALSSLDEDSSTSRLSVAQKLGVGGTTSLQALLMETTKTPEQKLPILINLYGINKKKAQDMLSIIPLPILDDKGLPVAMSHIIRVGDIVKVQSGKEHIPEHKGVEMKVTEINNDAYALLQPDGKVHKWYIENELELVKSYFVAMSAQGDGISKAFKSRAKKSNPHDEILETCFVEFDSTGKAIEFEKKQFEKFGEIPQLIRETKNAILDLLAGDPYIKAEIIAKQIGTDVDYIEEQISEMKKAGLLESSGKGFILTDKGINRAKNVDPFIETEIYTEWKFALSPRVKGIDAKGYVNGIKPTSHEFCVDRMTESNAGFFWTREDIDTISNEFGQNAWIYRGGWTGHHNAEPTEYCNHVWMAITRSKKKGVVQNG